MLLAYSNPIIKPIKKKETKRAGYWGGFLKSLAMLFFDFLVEAISDLAVLVYPPIGAAMQVIKIGVRFIKNVVSELIFYGEVNWKSVFLSTAMESLVFFAGKAFKGVNTFLKAKGETNRIFANLQKALNVSKNIYRFIRSDITRKITKTSNAVLKKIFKHNPKFFNLAKKINLTNTNQIVGRAKLVYKSIREPLTLVAKGRQKIAQISKAKFEKRIEKTALDIWEKNTKKLISQNKLTDKAAKRYTQALHRYNKGQIYFNSSWISGVRVYNPKYWEQTSFISFFLYFKRDATKTSTNLFGKRPLEMVLPLRTFYEFIYAPSKGKYYLKNLAWGWIWRVGRTDLVEKHFNSFGELVNSDTLRRYRIENSFNKYAEALKTDLLNFKFVKSHRTNKTQKIAYIEQQGNAYKLSFTRNLSDVPRSFYHTRQAKYQPKISKLKRIKRK
ncbi:hypothetical protein [Mycoplasma buteonis]|uniref:hypothetical protein n=1 Tax=Mycoplasma buteonis TaxID=171280 RepID=UPI00056CD961|nr:hypothetical protein [Mycoplasma buteonis]